MLEARPLGDVRSPSDDLQRISEISDTNDAIFMQSSKVSALLEEVKNMRQSEPTSKCLVRLFRNQTPCIVVV